ncbi:restriction endonuclease subunit S [Rhodococcoides kyotonense]|uniref:Type I restriction enzyme, S subunit n=1 Tax=Rhodococcoides kyotonense TaxID=398843 RepID=A0A239L6X1_9NOCA|nr:restriction endonuclease subunit S [Rhodococcus kyotonensis]SNT25752.1 type I restriction enzyme, S subunit [Rhodococcus kyotonensis]
MNRHALTTLAEVAYINPKLTSRINDSDVVSFLGMANVSESGTTEQGEDRSFAAVRKGFTPFGDGDILVAKITPCFQNGKIAQARIRRSTGFGSTEFHVIRPNEQYLDPRYLLHFLRQKRIRVEGEQRMTGSGGQRRVPLNFLQNLQIPLPPLPDQRQIAAILDQVDEMRALRASTVELANSLLTSTYIDMFGDPIQNPRDHPTIALDQLGHWKSGGTPSRSNASFFDGQIPWFSSGELDSIYVSESAESISASALQKSAAKLVPRGSLMLGMYDTAALKSAITMVDCSCNQAIAFSTIDPALAVTEFVYHSIQIGKEEFKRQQRGVRQKNLSVSMIKSLRIPLPEISDQRRFLDRIKEIHLVIDAQHINRIEIDGLAASLESSLLV